MNFDEYTEARRSKKWGIPVDDESITQFVARQPKTCPVCGCQVFDPFGMTVVIHDVAKCAAHNAKVSRSAPLLAQVGSTDGLAGTEE
jgi:RNA polymerase subunit RPABC4/transcription elongation factor Spt4